MKKYTNYKLQIEDGLHIHNIMYVELFSRMEKDIVKYDTTKRFYVNDKFRNGYYTYFNNMEKYEEIY